MDANFLYFFVFGIIFLWIVVAIYNGIIRRANSVQRAWSDLIAQERQKNKILPELEAITSQYKDFESLVQAQIVALRTSLSSLNANEINVEALSVVEKASKNVMDGFKLAVEAYPDLKASAVFLTLMNEVTEQQEQVGAAIRIFNSNVQEFNNGIQVFPNAIINGIFNRKKPVRPFADSQAQEGFEYQPNI